MLTDLRAIDFSRAFLNKVMSMAKHSAKGDTSFARHRNLHVGFELRASALNPSGAVIKTSSNTACATIVREYTPKEKLSSTVTLILANCEI